MKRLILASLSAALLGGCAALGGLSTYDEVIDKGISDFSDQLGAHAKNMGELAGKPEGTYDATLQTYNALDAKLDTLIARARAGADGKGCAMQSKIADKVKALLKDKTPPLLQDSAEASAATTSECNARLLVLVKQQLADMRELHSKVDRCGPREDVSCLRATTSKDAVAMALQTANAVAVVEAAKKNR